MKNTVSNEPSTSTNNTNKTTAVPVAGGYQTVDISKLDPTQLQAEKFVVANVPKLSTWTLVSVRTQIVAGDKYCFTFKDPKSTKTEEYCVISQPWLNDYMYMTLPDGTQVSSGGASATTTNTPSTPTATGSTSSSSQSTT